MDNTVEGGIHEAAVDVATLFAVAGLACVGVSKDACDDRGSTFRPKLFLNDGAP